MRTGLNFMYEESTHSFVVKVWLEEEARELCRPIWRGHVTHVMSKQQRYVKNLDDIADFIAGYLQMSGLRLPLKKRFRRWLRKVRRWLGAWALTSG